MILTREIIIRINESNISYYEEFGYDDIAIGEVLVIPIELLSYGSRYKIDCKCDGCEIVKEVIFKNYVKYGNKWGEYYCRKCSEKKRKNTLMKNHGVEYPIQNKDIKEKRINTLIDKFGPDYATKIKKPSK
jgi:hypothetical protein